MENPEKFKDKQVMRPLSQRSLGPTHDCSPAEKVKLAATAISLNVRLRPSDMPALMQDHALRYSRSLLDSAPISRPNPTHLARALKKVRTIYIFIFSLLFLFVSFLSLLIFVLCFSALSCCFWLQEFDALYGLAWHCVVGTSFGSFVTHSPGGFVYFSIDSLSVLLFKTEVHLVTEPGA